MKSYRKYFWLAALTLTAFVAANGELQTWVENIEAGSELDGVFYKAWGPTIARRPPKETRAELTKLIDQTPSEADLYSLRALEAEQQLDFAAAEIDWKKYLELASNKAAANLAVADFYHRRLQPDAEIAALRNAAAVAKDDPFTPTQEQPAWQAFERIATIVEDQALDGTAQYQAWVARYPQEPEAYRKACSSLVRKNQYVATEAVLAKYESAFPNSPEFPTQVRAAMELAKGTPANALAVYERAFRPLWPDELLTSHFALLKEQGELRRYLDQLKAGVARNQGDLIATARLYHFYRQQQDMGAAVKALNDFSKFKQNWTPAERETIARLYEQASNFDEAARQYHSLGGEAGLGGLTNLLLTVSDQPIQIGAGSLGFYKDIAQMDQGPGFLNGVLSLLLNGQPMQSEFDRENGQAVSYFHRVKASQLVALFEQKYPQSPKRAAFRAKLIEVYATYGDSNGVISNGITFLKSYPDSPNRTEVALQMADAYTRLDQTQNELSLYQTLLAELGKKANGRPIGTVTEEPQPGGSSEETTDRAQDMINQAAKAKPAAAKGFRSQDYVRVLDRYLARLVGLKHLPEALAVYRNEITRNSGDPGLYERFAAFLDQNKMGADVEATYKDAIKRFPDDKSWTHRLARWYLHQKMVTQYASLTRDVTKIFSGSDLEQYFHATGSEGPIGSAMYLQLNQYAHQRFPHNLTFVRNLLDAYSAKATYNAAAYEALLRQNWFNSPDLRARFFELLSRTKRLDSELAALEAQKPTADSNPAAARMLAEAEAWKTHYELAAAPFRNLAASFPAETQLDERAAALHRSLNRIAASIEIEANLAKADPRDPNPITRIGEMHAERERFDLAAPYFTKLASMEPGRTEGYIDSATVFWDYYRFDDALRMIREARQKFNNPALFAYEAGAIRENQRDYDGALKEYAAGAVADGESPARFRLLHLAARPALAARAEAAIASTSNVNLRIALYETQQRPGDLKRYLLATASSTTSPDTLSAVEQSARNNDMPDVTRAVLEKRLTIIADPAERLRARMELVRFFESQNDQPRATALMDAIYQENPTTLGAIRSAVAYYWRNKQENKAVATLTAAASAAQQPYQDRFRFEAVRKSLDSGQLDRANTLLTGLLTKDPYRSEYIAANAELLEKRGDDAGLRAYYTAAIQTLRGSPLAAEDKASRVASLRRALVPVLVRLKDPSAALDQYIEVLNRYPEDESLTQEIALFAQRNNQAARLLDFYRKTAMTSPKDVRWPVVVSRIETVYEDLPAALEWLGKARAVRPERTDLLAAKGPLEERLMRFEDAYATYKNLFELSYRDPRWMMKAGEQYMRLGRPTDALAAIRAGWLEARPETSANYLECARQARAWNLLDPAVEFTAKGLALTPAHVELVSLNGELAAQRHQPLPPMPAGLEPNTRAAIQQRWGSAIAKYATPEEKAALAAKLKPSDKDLASAAGFAELLAKWEPEMVDDMSNRNLIQIESQRAKFEELAARFEAASRNPNLPPAKRTPLQASALHYYTLMGNNTAALRILEQLKAANAMQGDQLYQYSRMIAANPNQAVLTASSDANVTIRDLVANSVIERGRPGDALNIVAARGSQLSPAWKNAYTALTGLYFGLNTPQIRTAFSTVLGPQLISEQLTGSPDEEKQVTGQAWYYYAARFGEYSSSEPYLLSQLEQAPGNVNAYAELANFYLESGNQTKALNEYDYVLQLNPANTTAHVHKAAAFAQQNKMDQANAEWRSVFTGAADNVADLEAALLDINQYKAFGSMREPASAALKAYFRKNGTYYSDGLLEAIFQLGGAEWTAELLRSAPEPSEAIRASLRSKWLPSAQRDGLYAKLVEFAQSKADSTLGPDREGMLEAANNARIEWIRDRLANGNTDGAEQLYRLLPERARSADLEILIAARRGSLAALLARYQRDRDHAPTMEQLRQAAHALPAEQSSQILEFVFTEELGNRQFTAANFLGLAEIRLKHQDSNGALELLKRMNLIVGEPFELLQDSADLLKRNGQTAEAQQYYAQLAKVRPWDPKARLDANLDAAGIAKDGTSPYAIRTLAARLGGAPAGIPELDLLASQQPITEAQAAKPSFVAARLAAASSTKDTAQRYRLLSQAVAIEPSTENRYLLAKSAVETGRFNMANALATEFENRPEFWKSLVLIKQRVGDLPAAIRHQQQIVNTSTGTERDAARKLLTALSREQALAGLNQQRRPVISENILPDRIVKPKLAALPANYGKGDLQ